MFLKCSFSTEEGKREGDKLVSHPQVYMYIHWSMIKWCSGALSYQYWAYGSFKSAEAPQHRLELVKCLTTTISLWDTYEEMSEQDDFSG